MVVLSPQHGGNTGFFSSFPVNGLHAWGILLVVSLGFQEIRHQPFSMTQPVFIVFLLDGSIIEKRLFFKPCHRVRLI